MKFSLSVGFCDPCSPHREKPFQRHNPPLCPLGSQKRLPQRFVRYDKFHGNML
jgi:hypothetical protein